MRFEIDAKEFRAALKVVGCCVVKKSNFPQASHVLLDATKGWLSLSASNLEQHIVLRTDDESSYAGCTEEGKVFAPYDALVRIAGAMDGMVKVFAAVPKPKKPTDKFFIECGDSSFTLSCLPVEDAPQFADPDKMWSAINLTCSLRRIMYAAEHNDADYLKSICFQPGHITATDSHRIARENIDIDIPVQQALVPLSAVKMLLSLDIPVGLFIDENRMVFYGHGYRFSTRLIDKKYPDVTPIFSETPGQDIDLDDGDVEEIEGVIEKAVIVFDTNGLMLSCAGQEIRVHIQGQLGFYTDYLKLTSVVQNFNLTINPVYLRDALRGCGLKSVLHIPTAADKPILIKACGAVHAIMPMRGE